MPNPPFKQARWPNVPLDEWLNYATHIRIKCGGLVGEQRHCAHQVIMTTEMLHRIAPGAVTYSDFTRRLRCRRCGRKGWSQIEKVGRD